MQFKLANIVLEPGDFLEGYEDLLFRTQGAPGFAQASYSQEYKALAFSGVVDFTTYFNAFSLAKWRQYTSINNAYLHIELCGADCDIVLTYVDVKAQLTAQVIANMYEVGYPPATHVGAAEGATGALSGVSPSFLPSGWRAFDIPIEMNDAVFVGVQLASAGTTLVRKAYFATQVDPARVRTIKLALATTTFNNEDYIVPNINLVRSQVLEGAEPIAQAFHMFVVDNGRTLNAEALSGGGVSVLSNPNVGGAGGFARGMLEALGEGSTGAHDTPFTHVVLMDDDVRMFPESFIRTFNLLSLANEEYADAFVQGAMLKLQEPNVQYEDVAYVKRTSGYDRVKWTYNLSQLADMVKNETISVEREHAYGAWWYSCIPVSAIRKRGLPLPLFIRIDDVEFGVREPSRYMTLGGICVWHSQFFGRFRASVDLYQYGRNMLIAIAASDIGDMRAFMVKYWRNFFVHLRFMAYENADLWLDALEDFLRGPEWLAAIDGAQLMKSNAQKNEKLVPVEELDQEIYQQTDIDMRWIGKEQPPTNPVYKAIEALPYSRHLLPSVFLKKKPAAIDYGAVLSPPRFTARRKTLVALDITATQGHIRTMDRARYVRLIARYERLRLDFAKRGKEVIQAYKDARSYLTSTEFWRDYLGLV